MYTTPNEEAMPSHPPNAAQSYPDDLRHSLDEIRAEMMLLVLPGVVLSGVVFIFIAPLFRDPVVSGMIGVALLGFALATRWLARASYHLAAWALIVLTTGCALMLMRVHPQMGLGFLLLPVGFATLFCNLRISAPLTVAASLVVMRWPLPDSEDVMLVRVYAMLQIWSVFWLVWLATHLLLTAMEWFRFSYGQNRQWLEQARDNQLRLGQALEDLQNANLQMTRLNRLAQAMRQLAEESRRTKEQFVANVSHELRTPLNMIVGFVEMIMQAPETYGRHVPKALLADLSIVLRNSQHLSSLIDDILDLSQVETGQMAITRTQVRLQELIEAAVRAVAPLFSSKGLSLDVEVSADLPLLSCDRTRIRQVLLNLLSNAGRFTERGGTLVKAWREEGQIVVSVSDTGPGIAEEDVDRLFRPFEQMEHANNGQRGSGLGLCISKSFVELHGGAMHVESRVGSGTTFSFSLPLQDTTQVYPAVGRWFSPHLPYTERARWPSPAIPKDRPRLIVIESGNTLCRLLKRYLQGIEIIVAATLEEAIREVGRVPAQALVVNDTFNHDRVQSLRQVADVPFGLPVIVCSVPGSQESAEALGVAAYLVKPIARESLLAALAGLKLIHKTILLVDDEQDALRLFRRMLVSAQEGYRVLRATNGRQALAILRQQPVDVLLMDLIMPEMDGFQLLAEKNDDPQLAHIPVIIISARDPEGQPIVSRSLTVMRSGGISVRHLIASLQALLPVLSPQQVKLAIQEGEELFAIDGFAQEGSGAERQS
jgi:signal transduction histidine kinase/CheY-like chemotaxis protein